MGEWFTVYPSAPRYIMCYEYSPNLFFPAREHLNNLESENKLLRMRLADTHDSCVVDELHCALQHAAECHVNLTDTYHDTLHDLKSEFEKKIQNLKSKLEQTQQIADSMTEMFWQHSAETNADIAKLLHKVQTTEAAAVKNASELQHHIREQRSLRDSNRDLNNHIREIKREHATCQDKLKEILRTQQCSCETLKLYKQKMLTQKMEIKTLTETVNTLTHEVSKSRKDIVDYVDQIENLKSCFFGWLTERGETFCVNNHTGILHDYSGIC